MRNPFITFALEELGIPTIATTSPVRQDPEVTVADPEPADDVVAELQKENAGLENEVQELNLGIMEDQSDSIEQNLDDAINLAAAVESMVQQLHEISQTHASTAVNCAFAAGLEALVAPRYGSIFKMAALEDMEAGDVGQDPKKDAASIAEAGKQKAVQIVKSIIDGVKKIIGWFVDMLGRLFTSVDARIEKLKAAAKKVGDVDPRGLKITNEGLINRLQLVHGNADAAGQFSDFVEFANRAVLPYAHSAADVFIEYSKNISRSSDGVSEDKLQAMAQKLLKSMESTVYRTKAAQQVVDAEGFVDQIVSDVYIGGWSFWAGLDSKDNPTKITGGRLEVKEFEKPESVMGASRNEAADLAGGMIKALMNAREIRPAIERLQGTYNAVSFVRWSSNDEARKNAMVGARLVIGVMTRSLPFVFSSITHNAARLTEYLEASAQEPKAA